MDASTTDSFVNPSLAGRRRRAALLLPLFLFAGCATGRGLRPGPSGDAEPWEIPSSAYGLQRLYRVSFRSPEGEGSFRLTLRLGGPDRYQASAVDPVGRTLWSLDAAGERGLFLDHRGRRFCRLEGRFDIAGVPLSPFPLLSLPALLLGRVPAAPASAVEEQGGRISFRDERERRWDVTVRDGMPAAWSMRDERGPAVWLTRQDGWSILSDRRQGAQVRWREILREELKGELAALEPPTGYREECAPAAPEDADGVDSRPARP
jgi:hypothetical protein